MPRILNANELRWLGEAADGKRGETLAVVWVDDKLDLLPLTDPRSAGAQIHVRTEFEGAGLQADSRVHLMVGEDRIDPNEDPENPVDAIFLTQSAVEKFVFPYYSRMQEPAEIQELKDRLFKAGVVAAAHVRPSVTDEVYGHLVPIGLGPEGRWELLRRIPRPVLPG